jgi:hypothetical protein
MNAVHTPATITMKVKTRRFMHYLLAGWLALLNKAALPTGN